MDAIEYQEGMSIEELIRQINSRLERIETMHNINNQNILVIDGNFRRVFKELETLRARHHQLYSEMDGSFEQVIKAFLDMQSSFEDIKKDVQGKSLDSKPET